MPQTIKVAACQVPEIIANPHEALTWIETFAERAALAGADLVCFPECYLQGYLVDERAPLHALDLSSPEFEMVLRRLARFTPTLVFGLIESHAGSLFNTAVVISAGRLVGSYRKNHLLGTENIFFKSGADYPVFHACGLKFGINICYDTNFPAAAAAVVMQKAKLIVCPANNMLRRQKALQIKDLHNQSRAQRCRETGLWLVSADVTGEKDGRLGIGPTAFINPEGRVVAQVPLLEVGMVTAEIAC